MTDTTTHRKNKSSFLPGTAIAQEEKLFYDTPSSSAINVIMETLIAGGDLDTLPARKNTINKGTTYKVSCPNKKKSSKRKVELETTNTTVTIELSDIDKLTGSNKSAKKLFILALIKANQNAIFNGQLNKDGIIFPLQDLVDIGFYKTLRTARRGFISGMDILTSFKIKGKEEHGKNKIREIEALEVLFTGANINKGQCTIYFNKRINWDFIFHYFTILPTYYFSLSNRASDLLLYIFYLANQNDKKIEKNGYFTISLKSIQQRLHLPSVTDNENPYRTIKQPVEEAIADIKRSHKLCYKNEDFTIISCYDESASVADYINNGYLKICFDGHFADKFIERSREKAKQIEKAEEKKERIVEQAIAINTAKAMENEAKNENS